MEMNEIEEVSRRMWNDLVVLGCCGAVLTPDGICSASIEELEELEKNGTKMSDEAFYKQLQKQDS